MGRGSWKNLSTANLGTGGPSSGSSPAWDKHCGEEISRTCSPAPQEFFVPPRVGSDPRAGGKTSFLLLF